MAKKKRFQVRVECPECACGAVDHMLEDNWREKYKTGADPMEIEIACPGCGTMLKAPVSEREVEE
ncbi:MAG: hypothetical protein AB1896_08255 [Thermodesulfobacteriota bacterium]